MIQSVHFKRKKSVLSSIKLSLKVIPVCLWEAQGVTSGSKISGLYSGLNSFGVREIN